MMYLKVAETLTKSTMCLYLQYCSEWASLVAQTVKRLPAIWETQVLQSMESQSQTRLSDFTFAIVQSNSIFWPFL